MHENKSSPQIHPTTIYYFFLVTSTKLTYISTCSTIGLHIDSGNGCAVEQELEALPDCYLKTEDYLGESGVPAWKRTYIHVNCVHIVTEYYLVRVGVCVCACALPNLACKLT